MFSHITVGSDDLTKAEVFYDVVLTPLGLRQRQVKPDGGPPMLCWMAKGRPVPMFFVACPFDHTPAKAGNGTMAAFLAPSREIVDAAYEAGISAGGICEGAPGPRDHYAIGYYGAYLRDLDGNKIHIVYRGDLSA